MNEETARKVYGCVTALDPLLNTLSAAIVTVEDEELRGQFQRAVGGVMGTLYGEIMLPLERLYPAFIPPAERPSRSSCPRRPVEPET
jgi:hypothetical protein